MTDPITVTLPHHLGQEEAARRLKGGLTRAAAQFPALAVDEESWNGETMNFRVRALGQAASGTLAVEAERVVLTLTLPWLLAKFAQVAQAAIRKQGNLLLEKK